MKIGPFELVTRSISIVTKAIIEPGEKMSFEMPAEVGFDLNSMQPFIGDLLDLLG